MGMSFEGGYAGAQAVIAGRPVEDIDASPVDCETAVLLRASLRPIFDNATSWAGLAHSLEAKGLRLAIRRGRLVLTECGSEQRFCSARFLGTTLRELAARLGRPVVRARPDRPAAGEFRIDARRS